MAVALVITGAALLLAVLLPKSSKASSGSVTSQATITNQGTLGA